MRVDRIIVAIVGALLVATAGAHDAKAQQRLAAVDDDDARAPAWRIDREASTALAALWLASVASREEHVACIAGERDGDVMRITRVQPIAGLPDDSTRVSAAASIAACRPPEWIGTVHTHVAHFDGSTLATFSIDDRNVMALWSKRWRATGAFCVLRSATDIHCEGAVARAALPNESAVGKD